VSADADDVLRQTVAELAAGDDCAWAGIFFVEDGALVLGPEAGEANEARRVAFPVTWKGEKVAELAVDGDVDAARLEQIAAAIADLCLVGWDTGGEAWEP
jgi:putative methionine-R-sulfoxide reductase with GAF domain